jgi:hypothetical protein
MWYCEAGWWNWLSNCVYSPGLDGVWIVCCGGGRSNALYRGFGGGGFGRSVVSYAPRPMLNDWTSVEIIMSVDNYRKHCVSFSLIIIHSFLTVRMEEV